MITHHNYIIIIVSFIIIISGSASDEDISDFSEVTLAVKKESSRNRNLRANPDVAKPI